MNEPYILHVGDCVDVLRTLPAESVDAVVTSPPYAMQRATTYGGIPEGEYPDWTVAWMNEVRRVLKDDGSVIINIRPHIKNGQISDYVLRTRLALRDAGWCELEELIWHKKGGAPLGAVARPRRTWESLLWFGKHGRAYSDPKAAGAASARIGFSGGRSGPHLSSAQANSNRCDSIGIARVSDVVEMSTRLNPRSNALNDHPAPFPWQLAEWCAKLICPPGGTILDPFAGSSSTGVAAIRNGWQFIGIDQSAEYVDMSRRRLDAELGIGDEAAA